MADNWYIIRTRTGYEYDVAWAFKQKEGIESYCPHQEIVVRKNGMRAPSINREVPLFPSYIFARGLPEFAIGFCDGYAGPLMGANCTLAKISDYEIECLRERVASGEFRERSAGPARRWFDYDEGLSIRALAMPFEGWTGIVEEVRADGMQIKVRLGEAGKMVTFLPWQIERINKPVEVRSAKG